MHGTRKWAVACATGALAAAMAIGTAAGPPAGAGGGDWIEPARDRYEAGQTVTMIGYGMSVPGARERGPFHAWLRVDPGAVEAAVVVEPTLTIHRSDVLVGNLVIEDVQGATDPYRAQRASITFDLPENLSDGAYTVVLCNDPCTDAPGYFMADLIHVGVDPEYPVVRNWPLTDPAIRWLDDDALLSLGDGRQVTAAEVRAGAVTEPAPPMMPVPAAPPSTVVLPQGPQVAAAPDLAGTDEPAGARDAASVAADARTADIGDSGAAAWWVAVEVAVLVAGAAAALAWKSRRRRPDAPVLRSVAPSPGGVDGDDDLAGSDEARPDTIRL